jgi:HD-like signal output (HDOD) protein
MLHWFKKLFGSSAPLSSGVAGGHANAVPGGLAPEDIPDTVISPRDPPTLASEMDLDLGEAPPSDAALLTALGTLHFSEGPCAPAVSLTLAMDWVLKPSAELHGADLTLASVTDAVLRLSQDTTRAADWVPRVPAVLPRLLKSLRDESTSAQDLAQQIEQDVVLVAEALREANSALHQRATPVTQTEEAVRLLGSQGLRLLIARVAFRPTVGADAGALTRTGAPRVWALGEACAEAARALAPGRDVDPFEAFLVGLTLHVGELVALRMGDRVAHLARPDAHSLGPRSVPVGESEGLESRAHLAEKLQRATLGLSHRVAGRWELPQSVVGTLAALLDPQAHPQWANAANLLRLADEVGRLRVLAQEGLLPASLDACAANLPEDARAWLLPPPEVPKPAPVTRF